MRIMALSGRTNTVAESSEKLKRSTPRTSSSLVFRLSVALRPEPDSDLMAMWS